MEIQRMRVVLIGSGNVATVLGKRIKAAGHRIVKVFSKNEKHAALLASQLEAGYSNRLENMDPDADLYIVSVSDDATRTFSLPEKASWQGKLVVHTAGSVSIDALRGLSDRIGVIYPLQSLRREMEPRLEIPLLIDARQPEDLQQLLEFGGTISREVYMADDGTRMKMQLAAVFVNNFGNHLFRVAWDYCRQEGLHFDWLLPLIKETAERLDLYQPGQMQTGPALRNDRGTIEKHLGMLDNDVNAKELYELFTKQIQAYGRTHEEK